MYVWYIIYFVLIYLVYHNIKYLNKTFDLLGQKTNNYLCSVPEEIVSFGKVFGGKCNAGGFSSFAFLYLELNFDINYIISYYILIIWMMPRLLTMIENE